MNGMLGLAKRIILVPLLACLASWGAGADHALNYRADDVAARIAGITGGSGADRVVEVALGRNLGVDNEALALHGTIAAYASDADPKPRLDIDQPA